MARFLVVLHADVVDGVVEIDALVELELHARQALGRFGGALGDAVDRGAPG